MKSFKFITTEAENKKEKNALKNFLFPLLKKEKQKKLH